MLNLEGLKLLFGIRKAAGEPVSANALEEGLKEASERIGKGCKTCGDEEAQTRYGMCFECAFPEETS